MTGLVLHLKFLASFEIEISLGFRSIVIDGIVDFGIVPPPILDSPFPVQALRGNSLRPLIIASALEFNFSVVYDSISSIGTLVIPLRYDSVISSNIESMSLSHLNALKNGSFFIPFTSSERPAMIPACGPPSNLSPL